MARAKQFIDKPCKKCGAQPVWYYEGKNFIRGTCVDCDKAYRTAQSKRRASRQSFWDPPYRIIDRACTKCGERPAWYYRHASAKDGYRGRCVECKQQYHEIYRRENIVKVRASIRVSATAAMARIKVEMLARYGASCACCGESNPVFLTLDHPENNGAAQRREIGKISGFRFYEYLKKKGWPDGYRVLCWNCNCGRQWNRANPGICPHEEERLRLVA